MRGLFLAKPAHVIATSNVFHSWNAANSTFVLDDEVHCFRPFSMYYSTACATDLGYFGAQTAGRFVIVTETVVENNEVGPSVVKIKGTQSTRTTIRAAIPADGRTAHLDFTVSLLSGSEVGIHESNCWLNTEEGCGGFAPAVSSEATYTYESTTVTVTLQEPVPVSPCRVYVTCAVGQCVRITPAH